MSSQCCPNSPETILEKKYLSNVGAERTDMFLQENNLYNVVLICLCQRILKKLLTCAMFTHSSWTTLHRKYFQMLSWSIWANIAQGNYQCNIVPWLTDNFSFIGISYKQCCPNTSETILHKKITSAMLDHSAQIYSRRKTGWFQYVLAYFLTGYNVGLELIYGFQDNNEQGLTLTGTSFKRR